MISGSIEYKNTVKDLQTIESKLQKKSIRKACRAAAKPGLRDARQRAPVESGLSQKSIKIRAMRRQKGVIGVAVGSRSPKSFGSAYYTFWQDQGWQQAGSGQSIPAKEFIGKAGARNFSTAVNIFADTLKREVDNFKST